MCSHDHKWTADDIPSLDGRLAVVTGANSGLGLETTRGLAGHGAKVILACRNAEKAERAMAELRGEGIPADRLEFRALDLAKLDSIREFAEGVCALGRPLDLLINNAGIMAPPYRQTADGFEMQFGTNHLGHFALTGRLLEPLLASEHTARVVTVSSMAHRVGRIHFSDLQWQRRYNKWKAYGQSKLANLMFTFELQRRFEAADADALAAASHPGYSATNLQLVGPRMAGAKLMERTSRWANNIVAQSAAMGALPSLYAATAEDVRGGDYIGPDGLLEIRGYPTKVQAIQPAYDRKVHERLWQVSVELTGVDFAALAKT